MWLYNPMAIDRRKNPQKLVTIPRGMAEEITEYRYDNRLPSDTAAIRQLLRIALDTEKQRERSGI